MRSPAFQTSDLPENLLARRRGFDDKLRERGGSHSGNDVSGSAGRRCRRDNPVRVIDFFVDQLDLGSLASARACELMGRPAYHAAVMLKLYIYATSTAFSPAAALSGMPAQCRSDVVTPPGAGLQNHRRFPQGDGRAIRKVCREFIVVCGAPSCSRDHGRHRRSKFKAVNSRTGISRKPSCQAAGADRGEHRALFVRA